MHKSVIEHLSPEFIVLELGQLPKNEAIKTMARLLSASPDVRDFERFIAELLAREKLCPTALGNGIAFPHARSDAVDRLVMAVGRSRDGIRFEDCGQTVHFLFVIGVPPDAIREYLGLVGNLARCLKDAAVRARLMQAATPVDFVETLRNASAQPR
jgi:mannitol/fructose-specific phosphotransferase system IIA component (Ntr-type)